MTAPRCIAFLLDWLGAVHPACRYLISWGGLMPRYEYRCEKCKATFRRIESMSEHERTKPQCPKCGSKKVSQVPGQFFVVTSKKS